MNTVMPGFIALRRLNPVDLSMMRQLTLRLIPELQWRRHGIGVLQGYVHEGELEETRVHIWHPKLMLPGIEESGNAHNHRFSFDSHVLVGTIHNTLWTLSEALEHDCTCVGTSIADGAICAEWSTDCPLCKGGGIRLDNKHVLYDFVHARLHDDKNRSDMRLIEKAQRPELYWVDKTTVTVPEGYSYRFPRGAYHDTRAEGVTVTLVRKYDQVSERARVCAPAMLPPVPAFSAAPLTTDEIQEYTDMARIALGLEP